MADLIVASYCRNAGQICYAGTRLVIEKKIKDEFLSLIISRLENLRSGKTWDDKTTLPPIINEKQWSRITDLVSSAQYEGGDVVVGGYGWKEDGGCFYAPTVIDSVTVENIAFREEFFGPIIAVQEFVDDEHACELAQHPFYSLAAGIHTSNINRALRLAHQLDVGTIWVNQYGLSDITTPFGGFKCSGNGKDQGRIGIEKYLKVKSVNIKY